MIWLNISNRIIENARTLDRNTLSPMFISVVDDEQDLVYLFKDALSQIDGIQVFAFSDPKLAIEHLKMNIDNYRIVISDYRMPIMTGIELLENIKKINPTVIRILISAFEIEQKELQECNCVDKFLQKPISMANLVDEVQKQVKAIRIRNNTA